MLNVSMIQIFFNLIPLGESSMTQPLVFSSSRMASERLKSLAFLASVRASASARISAGNRYSGGR